MSEGRASLPGFSPFCTALFEAHVPLCNLNDLVKGCVPRNSHVQEPGLQSEFGWLVSPCLFPELFLYDQVRLVSVLALPFTVCFFFLRNFIPFCFTEDTSYIKKLIKKNVDDVIVKIVTMWV